MTETLLFALLLCRNTLLRHAALQLTPDTSATLSSA